MKNCIRIHWLIDLLVSPLERMAALEWGVNGQWRGTAGSGIR
jgi:hypothetical protein